MMFLSVPVLCVPVTLSLLIACHAHHKSECFYLEIAILILYIPRPPSLGHSIHWIFIDLSIAQITNMHFNRIMFQAIYSFDILMYLSRYFSRNNNKKARWLYLL